MGQDRQMQMVGGNGGNQFRQYVRQNVRNRNGYNAVQNVRNQVVQNAVQNPGVQKVGNQNGLIVVPGIANQNPNENDNVVAARAEGNVIGNNGNQIRCYNCRGLGHLARNCTVRPRRRDAAYLQTQFKHRHRAQTDKAPVYDLDGSAEVRNNDNFYDNEIFNMFTQEEQYTELLEPISEPHQIQQNDSNVISEVSSVEQDGGTVEQHLANVEETRALYNSLYNNLAIEVEKVNTINALHLSTGKQITTLNEENSNLNKQLLMEKSTVSSLLEEKKKLKSDFKIREDELLDKQIQLENKIKELDSILVKTGQSIQTMHMHSPKPDSFYHTEQKMALGYQNPFYLKQTQQKQQSLYTGKVLLEKHDLPVVYDSNETLQLAQENEIFPIINQVDARVQYFEIQFLKEAAKFVRNFKSLAKEADESLAKHKALELEIERLLRAIVSEQKDTTRGTSANTKFAKKSILRKPPSSSRPKLYAVTPLPKSTVFPKVGKTHALSKPVTSNSVLAPT
nr:hypothetical protein [Tanacetum cinerariifolium]